MKKLFTWRIFVMIFCMVMIVSLWSCNDEDIENSMPFIAVNENQDTLTLAQEGGESILEILSNREWTIKVPAVAEEWLSISPNKGENNGRVTILTTQNGGEVRSAELVLSIGINSTKVLVIQEGEGDTIGAEALYQENCGTKVEKNENDRWPYVDQYTDWEKGGLLDQSGVTYSGKSANVSNSGKVFNPSQGSFLSNAPYVGMNSSVAIFNINNINVAGKTNFIFKFGTIFQVAYPTEFGQINAGDFKLEASVDGTTWIPLTYTLTLEDGAHWYMGTSEFKVAERTKTLSVRFSTSNVQGNQGYRFDDFKLFEGGNGELIEGGSGELPEPGDKKYITIAQLRAKGEVMISEELYVKAIVISDKEGGNGTSLKNIVISDGEAGIAVRFNANVDYAVGTELEFALNESKLSKYQGLLQLNNFDVTKAKETGKTQKLEAKTVSVEDFLKGNYESMYVAIADVEVVFADLDKKMVEGDNHTNINMEAKSGESFVMFSSKYSAFKDSNVPQGSGVLKGITSVNMRDGTTVYQLCPQVEADFASLIGERFEEVQKLNFGIPSIAGTMTVGKELKGVNISIPYFHAKGTESYTVSVTVTGVEGLNIVGGTKTLVEGNGVIELDVIGIPAREGNVTFTINGINGLTTNTVTTKVKTTDSGIVAYTSNVILPTIDDSGSATYVAKVNIDGAEYDGLKLGTSKKIGTYTIRQLSKTGEVTLSFYGVAWKGKDGTVKITVENGGTINGEASKEFILVSNDGATENSPFTLTVSESDKYSAKLSGITASTTLRIETLDGKNRAILFGINIK